MPISPVPCRIASRAASRAPSAGKNAREMLRALAEGLSTVRWHRALGGRPGADAVEALGGSSFVVAATPYADETLKSVAHVLLPISHLRRDLGHLRQPRRPVAKLCGCGAAARRSAPGLEGPARARQSRRRRRLRLPVVRRSARGTARAVRRPRRESYRGTHEARNPPPRVMAEARRSDPARPAVTAGSPPRPRR